MLLSLISYNCHEITAVSKRVVMQSESEYDCFIISNCKVINLYSPYTGGVIYMDKSNSQLQLRNIMVTRCSASQCAVFSVNNADIFNTEKSCFSECTSNDCSLGLSSGEQKINMSSVSKMSGKSFVLQQKAIGHEIKNYNMSYNTGTTVLYIDRILNNNTINYSILGNNTIDDASYRSNSKNTYFNVINFINNNGVAIRVEKGKTVYCLCCYFIGNSIDFKNEDQVFIEDCYYSSGLKFIGTHPVGNLFHPDAFYPTNIAGLNEECGAMTFPTGTPSPSIPENCVMKTIRKRSILRIFKFISPAVLNCL